MNDNLQNVLAILAQKLGTTVEKLWPYLVRQQFVSALCWVLVGALIALASAAVFIYGWRRWANSKAVRIPHCNRTCEQDSKVAGIYAQCLISLLTLVVGLLILAGNIPNMVVPEAAAVRTIINR